MFFSHNLFLTKFLLVLINFNRQSTKKKVFQMDSNYNTTRVDKDILIMFRRLLTMSFEMMDKGK